MRIDELNVPSPLALSRLGSMVGAMLEELRSGPLDERGRRLLREAHGRALAKTRRLVTEPQRRELDRVIRPLDDKALSEADLRLAYTQLIGWLQGVFAGAQLAELVAEARGYVQPVSSGHPGATGPPAGALQRERVLTNTG